jgi:hypothetical protein
MRACTSALARFQCPASIRSSAGDCANSATAAAGNISADFIPLPRMTRSSCIEQIDPRTFQSDQWRVKDPIASRTFFEL